MNNFKYFLASIVITGFFIFLWVVCFYPVPEANKDLLNISFGALIGIVGTIAAFYFGSSEGSQKKTDIMAQQAEDNKTIQV